MFTLRISDVHAAVAKAIGVCAGVNGLPDVLDYINRATERLLYEGKWKGTVQTFRVCVPAGACMTWPREMETIEAIAMCDRPYPIRSEWYEFNENGPGPLTGCLCGTLIDRGEAPAFDEVTGSNKKLAVFADRTEGTGKFINLQFYDQYGQWVASTDNGKVIDGEKVAIPSTAGTYAYTTNVARAGGLIRVQKDITLGVVRLYSYDTTNGALKPLAYYQPDEEVPVYRRSLIPDLDNDSCDQHQVTVRSKLRFIPARIAESFAMIGHREAIRLACKAVKCEEDDHWDQAAANWGTALRLLNAQLQHYKGDGEITAIRFAPASIWGGGGIAQLH